jgi:leader peptidase (prepilin peptidase)/N-methyltransferase
MLIHRLPIGISLINPGRSVCPQCNYEIKWYENLPVVSFLFLKGRCSNCSNSISIIYPIVEVVTGLVTVLLLSKHFINLDFGLVVALFYVLIVLSFIDFKHKSVPDYLLIVAIVLTLIIGNTIDTLVFMGGFLMLELITTFYIQNIKSKITKNTDLENQRALGEGDIPIAGVIGGLLGIQLGITAILFGAIIALIPALYNLFFKKEIETPFIPFLTLGLFIVYMTEVNIFIYIN